MDIFFSLFSMCYKSLFLLDNFFLFVFKRLGLGLTVYCKLLISLRNFGCVLLEQH